MNKILTILSILLFIIACNERKSAPIQNNNSINSKRSIQQHIDSSVMKNNNELKILLKIIVKNIEVKDNHLMLNLTKKKFLELGLSEDYYDRIMVDLENANNLIDSSDIKDAEKVLHESYKDLYIWSDSSVIK